RLTSGSNLLPPGLSLDPAGTISGTSSVAGTFPLTLQAADSSSPSQTDTLNLSIRIFPISLSGFGTPAVDGVLSPGEWDGAGCSNLMANTPGGGTTPARVCAMNDATNLYVSLRFDRTVVDPGNSLAFEFDNDNNGRAANG